MKGSMVLSGDFTMILKEKNILKYKLFQNCFYSQLRQLDNNNK